MGVTIFTYGTLMVPAVMTAVCARRYRHAEATLTGFARFVVRGAMYPAIVPRAGARTDGRVYFDVRPVSLAHLDAYEGALYERRPVHVETGGASLSALTYVIAESFRDRVGVRAWSLQRFCDGQLDFLLSQLGGDGFGA